MKKGSITRYDQELVLETIADYDNSEISAWILEPVKEQIGGGGGGVSNPILTINVVATGVSGEIGTLPLFIINDGVLQEIFQMVNGGSNYTYESIVLESVESGDNYWGWDGADAYPKITSTAATLSTSDPVNCTVQLDQPNEMLWVEVTDPTQNASFTLTIS